MLVAAMAGVGGSLMVDAGVGMGWVPVLVDVVVGWLVRSMVRHTVVVVSVSVYAMVMTGVAVVVVRAVRSISRVLRLHREQENGQQCK